MPDTTEELGAEVEWLGTLGWIIAGYDVPTRVVALEDGTNVVVGRSKLVLTGSDPIDIPTQAGFAATNRARSCHHADHGDDVTVSLERTLEAEPQDPEVAAIGKIIEIISEFDIPTFERIVEYASRRRRYDEDQRRRAAEAAQTETGKDPDDPPLRGRSSTGPRLVKKY